MIVSGGLPVFRQRLPGECGPEVLQYEDLRVRGIERMAQVVHEAGTGCPMIAQLEVGYLEAGPSELINPIWKQTIRALSLAEIEDIVACFVRAIVDLRAAGFDGVQLHAAHGGLLSCFLSPYTNHRQDAFGGSPIKRTRLVGEIVRRAREQVGGFPILIKVNGSDYVEGGIDIQEFPGLARELELLGLDAIEVSGGMWDCLARSEAELGFRPAPAPESHTRIRDPHKQSYFLKYAESLDVRIPVILVGGNRHAERLEKILQGGRVDFIAMSRPLIREPDLPQRWWEGCGGALAECVSCNSCLYAMYEHPGREQPDVVRCVCQTDRSLHQAAQKWLANWVNENVAG
jgi:2,4-dienoyl-CoA reductase-like NADH-dependent reductase (Old Yellow Enzyme family)